MEGEKNKQVVTGGDNEEEIQILVQPRKRIVKYIRRSIILLPPPTPERLEVIFERIIRHRKPAHQSAFRILRTVILGYLKDPAAAKKVKWKPAKKGAEETPPEPKPKVEPKKTADTDKNGDSEELPSEAAINGKAKNGDKDEKPKAVSGGKGRPKKDAAGASKAADKEDADDVEGNGNEDKPAAETAVDGQKATKAAKAAPATKGRKKAERTTPTEVDEPEEVVADAPMEVVEEVSDEGVKEKEKAAAGRGKKKAEKKDAKDEEAPVAAKKAKKAAEEPSVEPEPKVEAKKAGGKGKGS